MSEVRVIRAADLSTQTSQTSGMHRATAVSGDTVGSKNLWVGRVTLIPSARSGPHHHGNAESVICVTAGRIRLRYGARLQDSIEAGPGDYIYIPPRVIHQEINLSPSEPIDSIVIRDSQVNVVVNVVLPDDIVLER
jgi:uncharacterized RmlC-like cupin family protein